MEPLTSELKCVYIKGNPEGESSYLFISDAEARRHGDQIGLDTLVVHAVNYEY